MGLKLKQTKTLEHPTLRKEIRLSAFQICAAARVLCGFNLSNSFTTRALPTLPPGTQGPVHSQGHSCFICTTKAEELQQVVSLFLGNIFFNRYFREVLTRAGSDSTSETSIKFWRQKSVGITRWVHSLPSRVFSA